MVEKLITLPLCKGHYPPIMMRRSGFDCGRRLARLCTEWSNQENNWGIERLYLEVEIVRVSVSDSLWYTAQLLCYFIHHDWYKAIAIGWN